MRPKYRSEIDIYFHMTNHYRKLRNVKAIVDSSAPKKVHKRTTLNGGRSGDTSKRAESATSLRRTSQSVDTNREKSEQTLDTFEGSGEVQTTLSHPTEAPPRSVIGTETAPESSRSEIPPPPVGTETAPEDSRSEIPPPPRSVATETSQDFRSEMPPPLDIGSNNNIEDYEYTHFLLRVTEDILRNLASNYEEINKIIKSHIQANKERLNEERMIELTEDLKGKLNFQNTPPTPNSPPTPLNSPRSNSPASRSDTTSSDRQETDRSTDQVDDLNECGECPKNDPISNDNSSKSARFSCNKLVLKLELNDKYANDNYILVEGPLYLPETLLEKHCVPFLLGSKSAIRNNEDKPKTLLCNELARKLVDDDYDLTPQKDQLISDNETDQNRVSDDDFKRVYNLIYKDAATNCGSTSFLPINDNQSVNYSEIFAKFLAYEKSEELTNSEDVAGPHSDRIDDTYRKGSTKTFDDRISLDSYKKSKDLLSKLSVSSSTAEKHVKISDRSKQQRADSLMKKQYANESTTTERNRPDSIEDTVNQQIRKIREDLDMFRDYERQQEEDNNNYNTDNNNEEKSV